MGKMNLLHLTQFTWSMWLRGGDKGEESSFIYMPALRMWQYVLYDNQMSTICNSSSKKNLHAPVHIGCERTLKATHVISQKITLIVSGGGS